MKIPATLHIKVDAEDLRYNRQIKARLQQLLNSTIDQELEGWKVEGMPDAVVKTFMHRAETPDGPFFFHLDAMVEDLPLGEVDF